MFYWKNNFVCIKVNLLIPKYLQCSRSNCPRKNTYINVIYSCALHITRKGFKFFFEGNQSYIHLPHIDSGTWMPSLHPKFPNEANINVAWSLISKASHDTTFEHVTINFQYYRGFIYSTECYFSSARKWWGTLNESVLGIRWSIPPFKSAVHVLLSDVARNAAFLSNSFAGCSLEISLTFLYPVIAAMNSFPFLLDHQRFLSCLLILIRIVGLIGRDFPYTFKD